MLEIIVLKTSHSTEEEARKLTPYIQNCSVFSPENADTTDEEADKVEAHWNYMLTNKISRSKLRKICSEVFDNTPFPAYAIKMYDTIYRNEKPILFLERYNIEQARQQKRNFYQGKTLMNNGIDLFLSGKTKEGMDTFISSIRLRISEGQKRDEHIAKNFSMVEELVKKKYASLCSHNPLRLVVQIGSCHYPERFSTLPIQVIDLTIQNKRHSVFTDIYSLVEEPSIDYDTLHLKLEELAQLNGWTRKS